jgi:hypothetical protein
MFAIAGGFLLWRSLLVLVFPWLGYDLKLVAVFLAGFFVFVGLRWMKQRWAPTVFWTVGVYLLLSAAYGTWEEYCFSVFPVSQLPFREPEPGDEIMFAKGWTPGLPTNPYPGLKPKPVLQTSLYWPGWSRAVPDPSFPDVRCLLFFRAIYGLLFVASSRFMQRRRP